MIKTVPRGRLVAIQRSLGAESSTTPILGEIKLGMPGGFGVLNDRTSDQSLEPLVKSTRTLQYKTAAGGRSFKEVKVDTGEILFTSNWLKAMLFETWTVYCPAPVASTQSKAGRKVQDMFIGSRSE